MVRRNSSGAPIYAPLYIHTISTPRPKAPDISTLTTIGGRLQYYRREKSLLQKDMIDQLGIDRTTYIRYESKNQENYSLEVLRKIAKILEIDLMCLLDDYYLFLLHGQAQQIKTLRESMGLSQRGFAKLHGVYSSTVRSWENDKNQISKTLWRRLFQ